MHENNRRNVQRTGLAALFLIVMAALLSVSVPVMAQGAEPTPTPSDPAWRGFAAARDALREEKSLDLTIIRNYTFDQVEWKTSIDSCREETLVSDYRPVYFGWDFRITDLGGTIYKVRVSFDLRAVVVCDKVEDADTAAAPAPAGTPGAAGDLPAPVAGGAVGGSFELGGHVSGLSEEAKAAMNQSGMTWMKKQLIYNQGDGTGAAEGMISQATSNGYKVLIGIVGNKEQLGANFDAYIAQYAEFVGNVAAKGAHAIEVWNEPNIDREWPVGQINGANYTKLLAAAYNAIKSKNPNTIVISGAPAPTGFFGAAGCSPNGCNDDTFMQQMAQAGAASYMDCVGLHYNEGIVPPSQSSGDPRGEYPTYYFGSMTARGYSLFGGKPVCYTELGYLSGQGFNTPIPAGFAWANNVTVAQQASWLADAATRASQSGQVRLMIVWNVNFSSWGADPQGGYAMIRPDGTCPACQALGAVMGQ